MAANGDIYAQGREEAFARFGERLEGNRSGLVLVACTQPVSDAAREALRKSFAALDYSRDACTYARMEGLDANDAFALVEGIDPLCLIAADAQAAQICAQAARQDFPLMQPLRLFGRNARAFENINALLETEQSRQALWHLLKSLK